MTIRGRLRSVYRRHLDAGTPPDLHMAEETFRGYFLKFRQTRGDRFPFPLANRRAIADSDRKRSNL